VVLPGLDDGDLDPVLGEEAVRQVRVGAGQTHRRHLREHLGRGERLGPEQGTELVTRLERQRTAARADRVPLVLRLEADRVRDGEPRGNVARPLLLDPLREARALLVAPADDSSVDPLVPLGPHVQEARALRRAEPLVGLRRSV